MTWSAINSSRAPLWLSRWRIAALMPLLILFLSYGATTLLGNFLYVTPLGSELPSANATNFSWSNLPNTFTVQYWLLLLLPIALLPVCFIGKKLSSNIVSRVAPLVPEFDRLTYVVLITCSYAYVIKSLIAADAAGKFFAVGGATSAVEQRFALLYELGFWPQVTLKSILIFLTIYGAVRAARDDGRFWQLVTLINVPLLTACLTLLNMKWPATIFIITLGMCIFVTAKSHPYLKTIGTVAASFAFFLVLSVAVLRWFPAPPASDARVREDGQTAKSTQQQTSSAQMGSEARSVENIEGKSKQASDYYPGSSASRVPKLPPAENLHADTAGSLDQKAIKAPDALRLDIDGMKDIAKGTALFAPMLGVGAINRMALAAPFYFELRNFFPDCEVSLRRLWIKRDLSCEPTLLVYSLLFKDDGFAGRGTAPAATNIYAYALDGWTGAVLCTSIALAVIGLFLGLWEVAKTRAVFMAAFVMGGYTAYFFSQLPIEGPLLYDHGMIWWTIVVLLWAAVYHLVRFAAGPSRGGV